MVRMAHSMQSSLQSKRMETVVGRLAADAHVLPVVHLPEHVKEIIASNARKLAVFQSTLTPEHVELLLRMLNSDWSLSLQELDGRLTHVCKAGCCRDEQHSRSKIKEALSLLILQGFDVPLLYRWKFVQPASEFCLRGLLVHALLPHVWRCSLSDQSDPVALPVGLDEDDPDLSTAERQKVRATKVLQLLEDDNAVAARTHLFWLWLVFVHVWRLVIFLHATKPCRGQFWQSRFTGETTARLHGRS